MGPLQNKVTEEQLCELLSEIPRRKKLVHLFLETLGSEGQEWFLHRVLEQKPSPLSGNIAFAEQIGVKQLDPDRLKVLETTALFNYFKRRQQLLAQSLTAQEVAQMFGVSKQTVFDRIRDRKLIGLLENNVMRLPTFQFDPEGPNGVLEGLPEVFAVMSCSLLGKISWMVTPNTIFEGSTPIQALKSGKRELVVQQAQAIGVT